MLHPARSLFSRLLMFGTLFMLSSSAQAQNWQFQEEFNGGFSQTWNSHPDALPTESLVPFRQISVGYGGAPGYSFDATNGSDVLRLNNVNSPMWTRYGLLSDTVLSGSTGTLEARINTLSQGGSNIDGLFDLWLVNAADHSQFVRVGLFNDQFATLPSWNYSNSSDPYSTDGQGNMPPFDFVSETWYKVRINQPSAGNLTVSIWDDAGTNALVSHTFGHSLSAFGSFFQVGFSGWMGGPDRTHSTLSAVDYIRASATVPEPGSIALFVGIVSISGRALRRRRK